MPRVIANVNKRLSTGNLVAGQPFECSRSDAEYLKKIGWVREEEKGHAIGAINTKTYQTRALKAQPNAQAQDDRAQDQPARPEAGSEDLSKLTKTQLIALAESEGAGASDGMMKAELISSIRQWRYSRRDMRAED